MRAVARLTSDWTDRHTAVATALVVAGIAGLVVAAEPRSYWPVGLVSVVVTSVAALKLDAFGGIIVGLGSAASVIAVKKLSDGWTTDAFGVSLAVTLALVTLSLVTGTASGRLRDRASKDIVATVVSPAYGRSG